MVINSHLLRDLNVGCRQLNRLESEQATGDLFSKIGFMLDSLPPSLLISSLAAHSNTSCLQMTRKFGEMAVRLTHNLQELFLFLQFKHAREVRFSFSSFTALSGDWLLASVMFW